MKKVFTLILLIAVLSACNDNSSKPDVSNININLELKRFDEAFFKLDTNNLQLGLTQLQNDYPQFLPLFISNVLGLGPMVDSNQLITIGTRQFLKMNQPVFDTSLKVHRSLEGFKKEMELSFRYITYYYPQYKVPQLIATIGPLDALAPMSNQMLTPNYIGENFIAVSLQFYLGKDYSVYNNAGYASSVAPLYRSKRFSKEYMAADIMNLVIDDMYPDSSNRLPLIERFVEKGKRLHVMSLFLPDKQDSILTGYTQAQLDWCRENERSIFNYFTQNNLLYEREPALTQNFINEGPFTQGMPEQSPGNIGAYVGWQIVKSYLKKKGATSPDVLMKTSAKQIFEASAYRPK